MSIYYPSGIIKNLVAIVMAGVLAIYGLIVAIIISGAVTSPSFGSSSSSSDNTQQQPHHSYSQYNGWAHLCAGLCCGLTCLAAGGATGIAGEICIISTGLRAQVNHSKAVSLRTSGSKNGTSENGGTSHPSMLSFSRIVQDEGDAGKLYIASVTILSFSGAIGLYGFIVALIITSSTNYQCEL
jgi:V-type H+-transporting ATPase 16kDa proteolipid subunit